MDSLIELFLETMENEIRRHGEHIGDDIFESDPDLYRIRCYYPKFKQIDAYKVTHLDLLIKCTYSGELYVAWIGCHVINKWFRYDLRTGVTTDYQNTTSKYSKNIKPFDTIHIPCMFHRSEDEFDYRLISIDNIADDGDGYIITLFDGQKKVCINHVDTISLSRSVDKNIDDYIYDLPPK